jgi:hypothetical protein
VSNSGANFLGLPLPYYAISPKCIISFLHTMYLVLKFTTFFSCDLCGVGTFDLQVDEEKNFDWKLPLQNWIRVANPMYLRGGYV